MIAGLAGAPPINRRRNRPATTAIRDVRFKPTVQTNQILESFNVTICAYHVNRTGLNLHTAVVITSRGVYLVLVRSRMRKDLGLGYGELEPEEAMKQFVLRRDVFVAFLTGVREFNSAVPDSATFLRQGILAYSTSYPISHARLV